MDFYHSWVYVNFLNTKPFIWTVVIGVFAFNILGPILVWFVMNSKGIPIVSRIGKNKKEPPISEDPDH